MNFRLLIFIIFLYPFSNTYSNELYVYPELYSKPTQPCKRFKNIELKIETRNMGPEYEKIIREALDLNNDGICELFVPSAPFESGNSGGWVDIYSTDGLSYKLIGQPSNYWLGKERNNYARLFESSYMGHRTNPTHVVNVYYFDGNKYVSEHNSESSYGFYRSQALKAYKTKNYNTAKSYYYNAYRFNQEKHLKDANNLALALIKLEDCTKAVNLLNKHLNNLSSDDKKYIKAAKHNISLCNKQ